MPMNPGSPAATVSSIEDITRVKNLVDGTLTTITRVDRVMNVVDGTVTVGDITRVKNLVDGTISTLGTLDFVTRVRNLVDGTLSTVTGVDRVKNLVDGTLSTVIRADRVHNLVDGTISSGTLDYVTRVRNLVDGTVTITGSNTTLAVYFDRGDPGVNVSKFNGNAAVTPNSGIPAINIYATTSIFSVSGSTSGVSASGVTLVSPSANASFKVFAFALTTTAQAHMVCRFGDGSGTGMTEYWRVGLQAPSAGIAGANLAVSPPGFLFATGTSTTLVLHKDTGSLVHYSVSYIKESA